MSSGSSPGGDFSLNNYFMSFVIETRGPFTPSVPTSDVPGIWNIGDIPSLLGICFGEADIFLEMSKNLLQTD